eukprot:jgi/Botrbrau1/3942/Bobra.0365s0017.1
MYNGCSTTGSITGDDGWIPAENQTGGRTARAADEIEVYLHNSYSRAGGDTQHIVLLPRGRCGKLLRTRGRSWTWLHDIFLKCNSFLALPILSFLPPIMES